LAIPPAESSGRKQEELAKGIRIWPYEVFLFTLASDFLQTVKSYDMGLRLYFPSEETCAADLYHP
jgi:hypothetical protein